VVSLQDKALRTSNDGRRTAMQISAEVTQKTAATRKINLLVEKSQGMTAMLVECTEVKNNPVESAMLKRKQQRKLSGHQLITTKQN